MRWLLVSALLLLSPATEASADRHAGYDQSGELVARHQQGGTDLEAAKHLELLKMAQADAGTKHTRASAKDSEVCESGGADDDIVIAACTRVIEAEPNNPDAYFGRALAFELKGDFDREIADYTKMIEIDPNDSSIWCYRGIAYEEGKGDYEHALADYTKAIEVDPTNSGAYQRRGLLYKNQGVAERAVADLEKAVSLNPELDEAKKALEELRAKGAPAPSAASKENAGAAASRPSEDAEIAFWNSVKDSNNPAMLQAYLDQFPGGLFAQLAKMKLDKLQ